jgi:hypothetical protein
MRLLGAALLSVLSLAAGAVAQLPEIIPLADVRPGMEGYGLTVVAGDEISRFRVKVVGIMDEPGTRNDFVVVRVSGEAIERSGGIAQGMSGSPVYLEGKLAGALSRAAMWAADPEHPLGLVTPIESMLAVLDEVETEEERKVPAPEEMKRMGIKGIEFCSAPPARPAPDVVYAWPVASPIVASGLSQRSFQALKEGLSTELLANSSPLLRLLPPQHRGHIPGLTGPGVGRFIQAPGAVQSASATSFRPGGPIGVGLIAGDIQLGALGTVTLVDGDAVVAFGHPFLFSGPTDYFLTSAYIYDTVAALDAPFKLGALGGQRGAILADRWAGIGGRTDRQVTPLSAYFHIWDASRDATSDIRTDIVREPRFEAILYYIAGLEATDRALDRIGPGTVSVRYRISGKGLPKALERHNVFLSTRDIAPYTSLEAAIVTDILAYNEFADPGLMTISLNAKVTDELSAIGILDLEVDRDFYGPGDDIEFTVYLQEWRGEERRWQGRLHLPDDLDTPYIEIRAYGGPRQLEKGEGYPVIESLSDLIDYIEDIPSFDTLTVEVFALDPISSVMGEPWLYGVAKTSISLGQEVVYDQASLIIPFEGGD